MSAIRVLIVDDQTLVRRGIAELLSLASGIQIAGEAADGEEALRLIRERRPDVVLLDLRMPEMSGIQVLHEIAATGLSVPAIILTTFEDDAAALESMRAGARGFLLKDTTLEDLVAAIRTVASGGSVPRPGVTARALRTLAELRPESGRPGARGPVAGPDLTPREREVLGLMAGGFSNREIGEALSLSEGTVKNHVSSILSKLGVRDRTRAVLRALDLGLA